MDLWAVGAGMIIYLAALQGVPIHLREAALLDGANAWQRFRHVTLPAISPVVLFMTVTGMLALFQYFTQAYIMTNPRGGPEHSTLFYALYTYQNAFEFFKMGYACAMGWILFLLSLLATLVVFKTSARYVYYEEEGR
jgi:multiple sugar transport system permease protein